MLAGAVGTFVFLTIDIGSAVITNMNQPQAGVPYTYTADDTIDIVLAAGNPADNVAIALIIGYLTGLDITP